MTGSREHGHSSGLPLWARTALPPLLPTPRPQLQRRSRPKLLPRARSAPQIRRSRLRCVRPSLSRRASRCGSTPPARGACWAATHRAKPAADTATRATTSPSHVMTPHRHRPCRCPSPPPRQHPRQHPHPFHHPPTRPSRRPVCVRRTSPSHLRCARLSAAPSGRTKESHTRCATTPLAEGVCWGAMRPGKPAADTARGTGPSRPSSAASLRARDCRRLGARPIPQ
mmetsp:Transcript_10770/g.31169  ORF Transcript_10770/g.31169 Transcript_10770/m.31169 type:complete len:226 (+) Transcript_10770:286-963(+)